MLIRVIAANIRHLAEKRGIAIAHVADKAGIGRTTMWKLLDAGERGASDPRLSTIEAIAKALGVEAPELMRDLGGSDE
jgi:DNA-binding phage protein